MSILHFNLSWFCLNSLSSRYSKSQEERRPVLVSIDGGGWIYEISSSHSAPILERRS